MKWVSWLDGFRIRLAYLLIPKQFKGIFVKMVFRVVADLVIEETIKETLEEVRE